MFAAADANGDGVLDQAEYKSLSTIFNAKMTERHGEWIGEPSDEDLAVLYNFINGFNADKDGISLEDMGTWRGHFA